MQQVEKVIVFHLTLEVIIQKNSLNHVPSPSILFIMFYRSCAICSFHYLLLHHQSIINLLCRLKKLKDEQKKLKYKYV